jgi:hypothetical protein
MAMYDGLVHDASSYDGLVHMPDAIFASPPGEFEANRATAYVTPGPAGHTVPGPAGHTEPGPAGHSITPATGHMVPAQSGHFNPGPTGYSVTLLPASTAAPAPVIESGGAGRMVNLVA